MEDVYNQIASLLPSQLRQLGLALDAQESARVTRPPLLRRAADAHVIRLSFAQESLWFLESMGLVGAAYNMPFGLRLSGALDVPALEQSFSELVNRHESLRTRFEMHDGDPVQVIDPPEGFLIEHVDLRAVEPSMLENKLQHLISLRSQKSFDLSTGPLLRVTLVTLDARVRQAVVEAREDSDGINRLVAYFVPHGDTPIPGVGELRRHLKGILPEYMLPSAFIPLTAMPTSAGKLDRKALPGPEVRLRASEQVAPRTAAEATIASVWRDVLQIEPIGVHDNFFELGRDSIPPVPMICETTSLVRLM